MTTEPTVADTLQAEDRRFQALARHDFEAVAVRRKRPSRTLPEKVGSRFLALLQSVSFEPFSVSMIGAVTRSALWFSARTLMVHIRNET
jgi:hypothetical protein